MIVLEKGTNEILRNDLILSSRELWSLILKNVGLPKISPHREVIYSARSEISSFSHCPKKSLRSTVANQTLVVPPKTWLYIALYDLHCALKTVNLPGSFSKRDMNIY